MSPDNLITLIKEQFPEKDSLFSYVREIDKENGNLLNKYSEKGIDQYLSVFSRLLGLINDSDDEIPQIYAVCEELESLLQSSKGYMEDHETIGGLKLIDILFSSLENEIFFGIELSRATDKLERNPGRLPKIPPVCRKPHRAEKSAPLLDCIE